MMDTHKRPNDDEIESPFLRAFARIEHGDDAPPDISSDRLASRLVKRFNRSAPVASPARTADTDRPELKAWQLCRALTRKVGELRLRGRFKKRIALTAQGPEMSDRQIIDLDSQPPGS
jgi:hypothetical protein